MSETSTLRLGLSIVINTVIVIFELGAGFLTGSLSLMSDAIHNLADITPVFFYSVVSYSILWKVISSDLFTPVTGPDLRFSFIAQLFETFFFLKS